MSSISPSFLTKQKPNRIHQANGEFHSQAALITWAGMSLGIYPELKWLFAIPNGGHRSKAAAGKAKAEGVKKGVLDLCLPVRRGRYTCLYIEMKFGKNKPTQEQLDFIAFVEGQGAKCVVCHSWEEAKTVIENYLKGHYG